MKNNRTLFWMAMLAIAMILVLSIPQQTEELPKRDKASIGALKCTVAKFLLDPVDSTRQIAPLFENLGEYTLPVSISTSRAQAFFDQGMRLTFAFNHAEAHRSFMEAARLDPESAMAYWGQAYALGPNINDPLPLQDRREAAWEALQKANARLSGATPMEQALIKALNARYSDDWEADIAELNASYLAAMKKVREGFPENADVQTLYAAAAMNTMPWAYWDLLGNPSPETPEAKNALEKAIALNPKHPGAHHYYIHMVELPKPDLGVPSAEALADLMPAAGHLVHMPSHIFIRVGRYKDAVEANHKAIAADEDYISQCYAQGLYPLGYYPHNIHFLWSAASLIGESNTAITAAKKTAEKVPQGEMAELTFLQDFAATPLLAYVRFGKWNDILTYPAPAPEIRHLTLMRHYARGLAFIRKQNPREASEELEAIKSILEDPETANIIATAHNSSDRIAQVAYEVVAGELAHLQGKSSEAVEHLQRAVAAEDALTYTEPSAWHIPPRQNLGAVLMELGRHAEAAAVYREDLNRLRQNGWSLLGLQQALKAQGKTAEAATVQKEFEAVWQYADIAIGRSVF
jgi:tetratricopeptide (TPR) repeat protein